MSSRSLVSIEEDIMKLQKEKEELLKEIEKEEKEKAKSEEDKIKEEQAMFFKDKTEKDFYLLDAANVMAMGKIQNFEPHSDKPLRLINDFLRDNKDVRAFFDILDEDIIEVYKGEILWGRYSKEYYNTALATAKAWKGAKLEFYVQKDKHRPILMACDDLGFILAPRINQEDNQ